MSGYLLRTEAQEKMGHAARHDPKQTSPTTKEWLKQKKVNALEWPSQSPDLNPMEMLWKDLKWAAHARKPPNIPELKLLCEEEWAKISPSRCAGPINSYQKHFIKLVLLGGAGDTSY